jgi:hypothetical protein
MKNSNKREFLINALISSALTALFITATVSAATTISTNISTGGTLTVSGAAWASSTAQITGALTTYGAVTLGDAGADVITITGNASTTNALTVGGVLYSTGNLTVGGFATTTAASGNFTTLGTIGISTTTPWADLSIDLGTNSGFAVWNNGSSTPAFLVSGVNSQGRVGLSTTTPVSTLSAVAEVATSTLYLHSDNATRGACIQLEGAAGTGATFRLYATSTGFAVWESGTCAGVGSN